MNISNRRVIPSDIRKMTALGLTPMVANLYSGRGVSEAKGALLQLKDLIPYNQLTNAENMAKILVGAILRKDRLLIVADYDADGATSCAIMWRALKAFGANVGYIIPDRLVQGYGLTPDIAEIACTQPEKPVYLITVDNGIASNAGVDVANKHGVKVLVTDHHLPGDTPPNAECIVNPNQHGCNFPSKALAGCGVAFYVMWALQDALVSDGFPFAEQFFSVFSLLPIVAVGTVADLVSMDDNNRILVKNGMDAIRKRPTFPGIEQLCLVADKNPRQLTTSIIGFQIGPRINAAGRLENMEIGVECLITDSVGRAQAIAKLLNNINNTRKDVEAGIVEDAVDKLSKEFDESKFSLVLHADSWHEGVIGIAASRLKDKVWRPTIIMTTTASGDLKGSCRSIPGFHLRDALVEVDTDNPGLILKFGGHAMAAGLTVRPDGLAKFTEEFEKVAKKHLDSSGLLSQSMEVDGSIVPYNVDIDVAKNLKMQVWGQNFPEPTFVDTFKIINQKLIGNTKSLLTMDVELNGHVYKAKKFKFEGATSNKEFITLAYQLDPEKYLEKENLVLNIIHIIE